MIITMIILISQLSSRTHRRCRKGTSWSSLTRYGGNMREPVSWRVTRSRARRPAGPRQAFSKVSTNILKSQCLSTFTICALVHLLHEATIWSILTICAVYLEWLLSVVVLPYQAQEPYNPKAEVSVEVCDEKKKPYISSGSSRSRSCPIRHMSPTTPKQWSPWRCVMKSLSIVEGRHQLFCICICVPSPAQV
jgi:hypothetical protein